MNIKTLSLTIAAGSLLATPAMADYTGLSYDIVEQTGSGAQAGTWTARIYADFDNANDRVDAVYGNADNDLMVDSSSGFYQNTSFGGPTSTSINAAFFPLAPSLEWDSYVTIGALYAATAADPNALLDIGIDWTSFESGGSMFTDNGTWFVTPADAQGAADSSMRVLLGQFTMNGAASGSSVYGVLNIQGKDSMGETWNVTGQEFSFAVPAPGAIALLGLAGIASRRRRK
jgi:hypothetical protein